MTLSHNFSSHFSTVSPLNVHNSFPKTLGLLVPSLVNRYNSKNNQKLRIKEPIDIQQINEQEFNNVLQELPYSHSTNLKIMGFKQACCVGELT